MDFRLPGQAFIEMLEFIPEEGGAPVIGGVVGSGGEVAPGSPEAAAPGGGDQTEVQLGGSPASTDGGAPAGDAGT
jgi:hypothetical protein